MLLFLLLDKSSSQYLRNNALWTGTKTIWGGLWKELVDAFAFPTLSPTSVSFCILLIKLKSLECAI